MTKRNKSSKQNILSFIIFLLFIVLGAVLIKFYENQAKITSLEWEKYQLKLEMEIWCQNNTMASTQIDEAQKIIHNEEYYIRDLPADVMNLRKVYKQLDDVQDNLFCIKEKK